MVSMIFGWPIVIREQSVFALRSKYCLGYIQQLYALERHAKHNGLPLEQTKGFRLTKSRPVINELGKWIFKEIKDTLAKSRIDKAMAYAYACWGALSAYLYDGNLSGLIKDKTILKKHFDENRIFAKHSKTKLLD